jgi:hypothetical protein
MILNGSLNFCCIDFYVPLLKTEGGNDGKLSLVNDRVDSGSKHSKQRLRRE